MKYHLWDMTLESELELPSLSSCKDKATSEALSKRRIWRFRVLTARPVEREDVEWVQHHDLPNGVHWLSIGRWRGGYALRYAHPVEFYISLTDREIACLPVAEVPRTTLEHLLLDHALPLALSGTGRRVFHAGAVATPHGALAFAGASGYGKSTLTASLVQAGFPLLTDDCLLLEERGDSFYCLPSYPGLRLWERSLTGLAWESAAASRMTHDQSKRRLALESSEAKFAAAPVPLRRLYLLNPPGAPRSAAPPSIQTPSLQDALMGLVAVSFTLDVGDAETLQREFRSSTRLIQQGFVRRLDYPREFASLEAVHAAILADAEEETLPDEEGSRQ